MPMRKNKTALILLTLIISIYPLILIGPTISTTDNDAYYAEIAFVYTTQLPEDLTEWNNFLTQNDYNVTTLILQEVLSSPEILKNYDLIIMGNSTNNPSGSLMSKADAELIANQGVPIIATSYGGWFILNLAESQQSAKYDKISTLKIRIEDQDHPIYNIPFKLDLEDYSDFLFLTITEYYFNNSFVIDSSFSQFEAYAYILSDYTAGKFTGFENNTEIYFNFISTPRILSKNGLNFYINFIEYALGRSHERYETTLSLNGPAEGYLGQGLFYYSKLTYNEDLPLANKKISLIVNDSIIDSKYTNSSGEAELLFIPNSTGLFELKTIFEGDRGYYNSTSNVIIYNITDKTRIETYLTINAPEKIKINQQMVIKITLLDNSSNPIKDEFVNLFINGEFTLKNTTDEDGITLFKISFEKSGEYDLKIIYFGNDIYSNTTSEFNVEVLKNQTVIYLETPLILFVGEHSILTAIIKGEDNIKLTNVEISFYLNNTPIGVSLTDNSGEASIVYTPQDFENNTIGFIYAHFEGNEAYNPSNSTLTSILFRSKFQTELTIDSPNKIVVGQILNIKVKLISNNPNNTGLLIKIYFNGSFIYQSITDDNGVVEFNVTFIYSPGLLNLTAVFDGSTSQHPSSEEKLVEVYSEYIHTILTVNQLAEDNNSMMILTICLSDDFNNPLKGFEIYIFIDTKIIYSGLTDNKGMLTVYISLDYLNANSNNITILFNGSDVYLPSVKTILLNSNHVDVNYIVYLSALLLSVTSAITGMSLRRLTVSTVR
ncbi:MAG: hypothetical protein ACTSYR_01085 [Candidatus Odinarchaeia archaeon]